MPQIFDSVEDLKWHYHKLLCKGDSKAEFKMNQVVKQKNVNKWLERIGEPYRVKARKK